ncbi:MAG: hypothetical protein VST70_03925 [Nitrospirota bacterium]|nr:hypothetical protein [Nitrospirota bacterium]
MTLAWRCHDLVLGVVLILLSVSPASSEERLLSGSSVLLPLNRVWAKAYGNIRPVTVIQATGPGSGAGINSAVMGHVTIGVSSLFFAEKKPKRKSNTVFVPVRLGGSLPIVNMPPPLPLKKDRSLLALDLTKGQGWEYTIRNGFVPLPGVPGDPRLGRRFLELLPGNTYRLVSGG